MTKNYVGILTDDVEYVNTVDTIKIPAEILDASVKAVNTGDTAKIPAEILDALAMDAPSSSFTPLTRNARPKTVASVRLSLEDEPPMDDEDTARVIPFRE